MHRLSSISSTYRGDDIGLLDRRVNIGSTARDRDNLLTWGNWNDEPYGWRLMNGSGASGLGDMDFELRRWNASQWGPIIARMTCMNTSMTYGRGATDSDGQKKGQTFAVHRFALGNEDYNTPDARHMSIRAAPPGGAYGTSHAVGEWIFNIAPSHGQPIAWVCTVAGDPGTWVSIGNLP